MYLETPAADRLMLCLDSALELVNAITATLKSCQFEVDLTPINRKRIDALLEQINVGLTVVRLDTSAGTHKEEVTGLLADGLAAADRLAHNWAVAHEDFQVANPAEALKNVRPDVIKEIAAQICAVSDQISEVVD